MCRAGIGIQFVSRVGFDSPVFLIENKTKNPNNLKEPKMCKEKIIYMIHHPERSGVHLWFPAVQSLLCLHNWRTNFSGKVHLAIRGQAKGVVTEWREYTFWSPTGHDLKPGLAVWFWANSLLEPHFPHQFNAGHNSYSQACLMIINNG